MKYKVRDQFAIKQGKDVFHGGDIIELDDAGAENWAHAIEPAEKPAPKKAKADDTSDAAK